jgi:hypothetical protein
MTMRKKSTTRTRPGAMSREPRQTSSIPEYVATTTIETIAQETTIGATAAIRKKTMAPTEEVVEATITIATVTGINTTLMTTRIGTAMAVTKTAMTTTEKGIALEMTAEADSVSTKKTTMISDLAIITEIVMQEVTKELTSSILILVDRLTIRMCIDRDPDRTQETEMRTQCKISITLRIKNTGGKREKRCPIKKRLNNPKSHTRYEAPTKSSKSTTKNVMIGDSRKIARCHRKPVGPDSKGRIHNTAVAADMTLMAHPSRSLTTMLRRTTGTIKIRRGGKTRGTDQAPNVSAPLEVTSTTMPKKREMKNHQRRRLRTLTSSIWEVTPKSKTITTTEVLILILAHQPSRTRSLPLLQIP